MASSDQYTFDIVKCSIKFILLEEKEPPFKFPKYRVVIKSIIRQGRWCANVKSIELEDFEHLPYEVFISRFNYICYTSKVEENLKLLKKQLRKVNFFPCIYTEILKINKNTFILQTDRDNPKNTYIRYKTGMDRLLYFNDIRPFNLTIPNDILIYEYQTHVYNDNKKFMKSLIISKITNNWLLTSIDVSKKRQF